MQKNLYFQQSNHLNNEEYVYMNKDLFYRIGYMHICVKYIFIYTRLYVYLYMLTYGTKQSKAFET